MSLINSHEEVFVARTGLDRKATSQVTGSPVRARERESIRDSMRGKHAMYIIIRERRGINEGVGASDRAKSSASRKRYRGFGGGGAKSFAHEVHVTTGSGDGNRGIT